MHRSKIYLGLSLLAPLLIAGAIHTRSDAAPPQPESRIQRGLAISPVPLDLQRKNRALVALGSYLVNAVGSCADCHSCPTYAPGHDPYTGGDGEMNSESFLAGGVPFGPVLRSANLTPDDQGRPAGLTLAEFMAAIRTGHDPETGDILQVMPWPVLRKMVDRDLVAIYEYLGSIPSRETPPEGSCVAPGQ